MRKVYIYSCSEESAAAYQEAMAPHGFSLASFSSGQDLYNKLFLEPASGIVIDVPSIVRANPSEKLLLQELTSIYPTLKATLGKNNSIRAVFHGGSGTDIFAGFADAVRAFAPRSMRSSTRIQKFLHIELYPDRECSGSGIKTYTVDISDGGCFIAYTGKVAEGDEVCFRFPETEEPVFGEVRWLVPWGEHKKVPGFGCKFKAIEKHQKRLIDSLMN